MQPLIEATNEQETGNINVAEYILEGTKYRIKGVNSIKHGYVLEVEEIKGEKVKFKDSGIWIDKNKVLFYELDKKK